MTTGESKRFTVVTTVKATLTEHWIVDAPDAAAALAAFANGEIHEAVEYDGQEEESDSGTREVISVALRKARK